MYRSATLNLAKHKALRRLSSLPEKQFTCFLITHHKFIRSNENIMRYRLFYYGSTLSRRIFLCEIKSYPLEAGSNIQISYGKYSWKQKEYCCIMV